MKISSIVTTIIYVSTGHVPPAPPLLDTGYNYVLKDNKCVFKRYTKNTECPLGNLAQSICDIYK